MGKSDCGSTDTFKLQSCNTFYWMLWVWVTFKIPSTTLVIHKYGVMSFPFVQQQKVSTMQGRQMWEKSESCPSELDGTPEHPRGALFHIGSLIEHLSPQWKQAPDQVVWSELYF